MIRVCPSCCTAVYDRSLCNNCGDATEDVHTIESVIMHELLSILIDSKFSIDCSVVYHRDNFEIRIWLRISHISTDHVYYGHIIIDDGNICMHQAPAIGRTIRDPILISIADPTCFDQFKLLLPEYLSNHMIGKCATAHKVNDIIYSSNIKPRY